jgi:hypothetical protein
MVALGYRIPHPAAEDTTGSRALEIDNEKEPSEETDPDQAPDQYGLFESSKVPAQGGWQSSGCFSERMVALG